MRSKKTTTCLRNRRKVWKFGGAASTLGHLKNYFIPSKTWGVGGARFIPQDPRILSALLSFFLLGKFLKWLLFQPEFPLEKQPALPKS